MIQKEFQEKGVSGFKISADDRDAIQELKTAAEHGEFDILLVFMFDRLGRIDNETPFVVEWFIKHGISVWSMGLIPGWGRSPGGGLGNPLQYSCLENTMDREAWWASVHGVARVRHD